MLSVLEDDELRAIDGELMTYISPHAAMFNYRVAFAQYLIESAICTQIAEDVVDGLVIDEEASTKPLLRASAFFKAAKRAKELMLGTESDIITYGGTYKIDKIEIVDGVLVSDVRLARREARRQINDLLDNWDYQSFEISVYAMILIEEMAGKKEAA